MGIHFRGLFAAIILLGISGCAPVDISVTPTAFTPVITPQATRLTVTQTVADEDETPAPIGDCETAGSVERFQIDSVFLKGPLYFHVYFPPCYDEGREGGYSVLYALHGQNFNDQMWIDLGAAEIADQLILDKETAPFMIVMPYEEYYYRGTEANQFPSALKDEIIIWVEETLNVCVEKTCRAIGGISRGAAWAMRIGLAEWEFFGAIGAHSLPTFRGDISALPDWLEEIPYGEEPRVYMDTGRFDPEVKNAYRFEQVLSAKGIPHDWHLNEGRHNEVYWAEQMEAYLRWYSEDWK